MDNQQNGLYYKIAKSGYTLYRNQGGTEIGVAKAKVIEKDGFAFRDLAGTGELLPYEDWRLSNEQRL